MDSTPRDAIVVGGRTIRITNPGRVLYPSAGITKADVITYYLRLANRMLPYIRRRPVTRIRWPHGVDGQPFFEKQLPSHAPDWIERITLDHSDRPITYPMADNPATLVWFAQQNALELHVPQWRTSGSRTRTDRFVLDLDPGSGTTLIHCTEIALWLRDVLAKEGMLSVPVTSGSKGIHVYARWRASRKRGSSSEYARDLAESAQQKFPKLVTANMAKRERDGKVLIDWSQNNPAKTTVAPYSLRGRTEPFVAAPREWSELSDPLIKQLTMSEVVARLDRMDPLSALD